MNEKVTAEKQTQAGPDARQVVSGCGSEVESQTAETVGCYAPIQENEVTWVVSRVQRIETGYAKGANNCSDFFIPKISKLLQSSVILLVSY